jgi:hypothetical protein
MGDHGADDAVGYKRPPSQGRFRPGRSGNPAGRPKRRPSFLSALLSELATPMPGTDHKTGTKLDALVKCLVSSAIAGDRRTQALLVNTLARIGETEQKPESALTADDQAILDDYVGGELKRRASENKLDSQESDD